MTTIVRRNCWRLLLVVGLWVAVFSINDTPVAAGTGCGDAYCAPGEPMDCPIDCTPDCGDGVCHAWELGGACPQDCSSGICGDNTCEAGEEDWCEWDCPECGDSICHPSEQTWCYYDCAP
jgi:hypothetical protein